MTGLKKTSSTVDTFNAGLIVTSRGETASALCVPSPIHVDVVYDVPLLVRVGGEEERHFKRL